MTGTMKFVAGALTGAFAATAFGCAVFVKPLEEHIGAFKTANDVAALHVKAYALSQEARALCGAGGILGGRAENTQDFIEGLSHSYRRNAFPVAQSLAWIEEMRAAGVRFLASDDLPRNVAAQFFNTADDGKVLVFSSGILFSSETARMFDFHRQVKEAGYGQPGQVMALIKDSPIPGENIFTVVSGPVGMEQVIVEKDEYRMPVAVASGPC